eukprot:TRINITY_DN7810_c0_g1_i1.p2 TRINITY_DN7810_c0_g1~~TRINITY_DN7810_c0_g1_i1.p2  ORF type:complete len:200 (-),score=97.29 TRINITY_DN7810_c0_g1_i1:90-689(-)
MGIDLKVKHKKKSVRTEPDSKDVYLRLIVRLYRFLARRTRSDFNKVILKRLCMSKINRPALNLARLVQLVRGKGDDKIAAVVGTVTDDSRLFEIPKVNVCALRFTRGARARIVRNGGRCLTFDQLALKAPTGNKVLLIRGPKNARKAVKHFGAAGVPGSKARPYSRGDRNRKVERARGRRNRPLSRAGKGKGPSKKVTK